MVWVNFTHCTIGNTEVKNFVLAILVEDIVSKNSICTNCSILYIGNGIDWGIEQLRYS